MEIKIKKNVYLRIFTDMNSMRRTILNFIFDSKTDKILYKGDPSLITYKTMKKIFQNDLIIGEKSYDFKDTKSDVIKDTYKNFIEDLNIKHCIFYKK